jgi:flagellar motor protein MotB
VAYFIPAPPRIGRSQGASIFWGLISVCFASGACYYYWQNHENERVADQWHDQAMQLQDRSEELQAQKTHLAASMADEDNQIKAREDLVQEKETELATEEMRVEGLGRQTATIAAQNQAQVAMVRKFNDVIRKLGGATPPDVVERSGRPVLRVANDQLFAPGDSTLTPDGKQVLTQIAQAIVGNMDTFELRVVCYTDFDAEAAPGAARKDSSDPQAHNAAWNLTAARATALSHFFRDETQLPFLNVLVLSRGDAEPIAPNAGDDRVHNRRVEISVSPLPVPFHSPDPDKTPTASPASSTATATGTITPAKKKKTEQTPAH